MDNYTDGNGKQGSVPLYFWVGGALLGGGLFALSWLYYLKNEEVKILRQDLTTKEAFYILERDSLINELNLLTADNGTLGNNLVNEQAKYKRMESIKDVYAVREKRFRKEFSDLKENSKKNVEENDVLKANIVALRSDIEGLRLKLAEREKQLSERDKQYAEKVAMINKQSTRIEVDSIKKAALIDSLRREDVAGYFNNTEITGAYGLSETKAPYAQFYWGITNINGYMINKHFLTGLGLGLINYNTGWMAPLYLDFRYNFNKRKYTPYIFADGGLLIDLKTFKLPDVQFMNPGIGLYRSFSDRYALNIGAGLFVQRYDIRSSFVNIKIGFTFKK
jgi:hypothetical protein